VALKVLNPTLAGDEAALHRFMNEGINATALAHENIVRIYESGFWDGHCCIVMELISGGTLAQRIKERGELLAPQQATDILSQIAAALDYAHSMGFLHRDLKLSNILLREDATALLADFGASKYLFAANSDYTVSGEMLGTPSFMSPEQATGGVALDARTDVYSLGVVAYKLFTGRLPFQAESQPELIYKLFHTRPVSPSVLNPELPPTIDRVLLRVLARLREQRYASAGEFVAALVAAQVYHAQRGRVQHRAQQGKTKRPAQGWRRLQPALVLLASMLLILVLLSARALRANMLTPTFVDATFIDATESPRSIYYLAPTTHKPPLLPPTPRLVPVK
jgi:eukaryotic-like serine/threonine-protein kinase